MLIFRTFFYRSDAEHHEIGSHAGAWEPEEDTPFMASLLYYFGVLTFDGYTANGELILKIPNLVMRKLYIERLQDLFLPDWTSREQVRNITRQFYQTGNLQPLCQFLTQTYFYVQQSEKL